MMEIYDAMSTLRAVRRLRPDPIADDVLERILTAATWAPTGGNMQPWRIVVVTDAEKKQRLEQLRLVRAGLVVLVVSIALVGGCVALISGGSGGSSLLFLSKYLERKSPSDAKL